MKKLYLILAIFTFLMACEKEEFERFKNEYPIENVVKIDISASSDYLFADGNSQLDFYVTAYYEDERSIKLFDDGVVIDTTFTDTVQYRPRNLPEGFNIFTESGDLVENFQFSTTTTEPNITFYAEAGSVRSENVEVKISQVPELELEQYTIPVVFHIVSTADYKDQLDAINEKKIAEIVNTLNAVFSKESSPKAPHSIDLKIKFELVSTDPDGNDLLEAGINRVELGDASESEAYDYLIENMMWDYTQYLNIWICQTSPWAHYYDPEVNPPSHITTDPSILPGLSLTQIEEGTDFEISSPEEVGLVYAPAHFGATEGIIKGIGKYFGLMGTEYWTGWGAPTLVDGDTDYCSDTYTYKRGPIGIWKTNLEGKKMKSRNLMDNNSLGTIITYDQGMRVRNVIKYCPLRQHLK